MALNRRKRFANGLNHGTEYSGRKSILRPKPILGGLIDPFHDARSAASSITAREA